MHDILEQLFSGTTLSRKSAADLLGGVADGRYPSGQVAALLALYRSRPVSAEELLGFRDALMIRAIQVPTRFSGTIDICGTGGDGRNSFNISTAAAFVVAGAGGAVTKHGNYSASSQCGSSNVIEALGVPFASNADEVAEDLERGGFAYLHAPLWHPSLKGLGALRKELGFRTIFNLLGPLVNPLSPDTQLIGIADEQVMVTYSEALTRLPLNFTLVRSDDGFDEVSLTAPLRIATRNGVAYLRPDDFSLGTYQPGDLVGGSDPRSNALLIESILSGSGSRAQEDVVVANAALALATMNPELPLPDAAVLAREVIRSGKAREVLENARRARRR